MSAGKPKQYLPLRGRALLEWSLAPFLQADWIDGVVVVLASADRGFAQLQIARHPRLLTVSGGAERADSVLAGLSVVTRHTLEPANTMVLVHDAARPCLRRSDLERLRDEVNDAQGGLLAMPVIDTLKQGEKGQVTGTADRSGYWRAQTPQMFRVDLLAAALAEARAQGRSVTDEASAMERAGYRPRLVGGSEGNLKVTFPDDLALAEFWLGQQTLRLGKE